jgi:lipid II:glycine glycyltransferase (peptidoglycan interpeptide bridge formation enzyme)
MWIKTEYNQIGWDKFIKSFNGNIKQSFNWGEVKKSTGWKCERLIYKNENDKTVSSMQFLFKLKFLSVFIYIPGGIINDNKKRNKKLLIYFKNRFKNKFIYLRLHDEQDKNESYIKELEENGWTKPAYTKSTNIVAKKDILFSEEDLLKSCKQKWRYNHKKYKSNEYKIIINEDFNINEVLNLSKIQETEKNIRQIHGHFDYQLEPISRYFKEDIIVARIIKNKKCVGIKAIILFNNIAWDFLTVYTNDGLNLNCGYSAIIEICNYLREKNIDTFELGELNQKDFPGVYQFKMGFVKDPKYINGEYLYTNSKFFSSLIDNLLNFLLGVKKNFLDKYLPILKI